MLLLLVVRSFVSQHFVLFTLSTTVYFGPLVPVKTFRVFHLNQVNGDAYTMQTQACGDEIQR